MKGAIDKEPPLLGLKAKQIKYVDRAKQRTKALKALALVRSVERAFKADPQTREHPGVHFQHMKETLAGFIETFLPEGGRDSGARLPFDGDDDTAQSDTDAPVETHGEPSEFRDGKKR